MVNRELTRGITPQEEAAHLYQAAAYLQTTCHEKMKHWWVDLESGQQIDRNVAELLMLCVTELAEACEGHRKNLMDDKLPSRPMLEVELADAVIRIFDLAGGLGLDMAGALVEKMQYNASREDHTRSARLSENGKRY